MKNQCGLSSFSLLGDYNVPQSRVIGVSAILGKPHSSGLMAPSGSPDSLKGSSISSAATWPAPARKKQIRCGLLSLAELRSIALTPFKADSLPAPTLSAELASEQASAELVPKAAQPGRCGTAQPRQRSRLPVEKDVSDSSAGGRPSSPSRAASAPGGAHPRHSGLQEAHRNEASPEKPTPSSTVSDVAKRRMSYIGVAATVPRKVHKPQNHNPFLLAESEMNQSSQMKQRWLAEDGDYTHARIEDLRREQRFCRGAWLDSDSVDEEAPRARSAPQPGRRTKPPSATASARIQKRGEAQPYIRSLKGIRRKLAESNDDLQDALPKGWLDKMPSRFTSTDA